MPKVIQVILTEEREGQGTMDNPTRLVTRVHTLDGDLIAENDPCMYDGQQDLCSKLNQPTTPGENG